MFYVLTSFLSAFLLFMIQPLIGKFILPWFGGSPAVWTTCMLFFQVGLLGGYTYAHVLSSRFRPKTQARLHVVLLGLSLGLMAYLLMDWGSPILPDDGWKPEGTEAPAPLILSLLSVSIGLPYLLLAATSPLVQRWFSFGGHGEKTYRLYAVSNAGSLLGLLCYPFVVERFLTVPTQAFVWSGAFVLFAVLCAVCALTVKSDSLQPESTAAAEQVSMPGAVTVLIWLLLTMCTSAMLLAVTNQMCQEISAVPFLWVLPLSIYLLTFIICFDRPKWYNRRLFVAASAVFTVVVLATSFYGLGLTIPIHVVSYSVFLFFFCMTCHGELVGLKPDPKFLTYFYLLVALGGALGGLFVGLAAPELFTSYWEFNVMVTFAWAVLAFVFFRDKQSFFFRGDRLYFYLFAWFVCLVAIRLIPAAIPESVELPSFLLKFPSAIVASALIATVVAFVVRHRKWPASKYWPGIVIGIVIALAEIFMVLRMKKPPEEIAAERNFFGALSVEVRPAAGIRPSSIHLINGQIDHGYQYVDDELSLLPISYYGPGTGIDVAVNSHPRRRDTADHPPQPLRIGAIGLGTGTIAAYPNSGDYIRFYEINPVVIEYSGGGPDAYFTYIVDGLGETEIVLGDARLSLERELKNQEQQQFDILVMDAFSSDSIPIHLLTQEAFRIYAQHLRDEDSIIAVHITNRFLDLRDVVATAAEDLDLIPLWVEVEKNSLRSLRSDWILLTRSKLFLADPSVESQSVRWTPRRKIHWTDSFSNMFHVLK